MLTVISFLVFGCIVGVALRRHEALVRHAERASSWSILLLLFVLGLSVGTNETVLSRFSTVGLSGILLALGATFGSVLATLPLYLKFFRNPRNGEDSP